MTRVSRRRLLHRAIGGTAAVASTGVLLPAAHADPDGPGDDGTGGDSGDGGGSGDGAGDSSGGPEDGSDDPALQQKVASDEEIIEGQPTVLDEGHVDLGPRIVDGQWMVLARDDSVVPSVWRHLEDVVVQIHDAGMLEVPAGEEYAFLGAEPGTKVYTVPQVEIPGVVWLGWNTQDPAVVEKAPAGVSFVFHDVQGPGQAVLFLQPGNFAPPQLLVSSATLQQDGKPNPQEVFAEINTHVHANWVFTEPGVYLMDLELTAQVADGEALSASATLRFAVGDSTDTEQALSAAWEDSRGPEARGAAGGGTGASDGGGAGADGGSAGAGADGDGSGKEADGKNADGKSGEGAGDDSTVLPWLIGGGAAALALASGGVAALRGRSARAAREAAWAEATGDGTPDSGSSQEPR